MDIILGRCPRLVWDRTFGAGGIFLGIMTQGLAAGLSPFAPLVLGETLLDDFLTSDL